jgi:Flp pilus assembly pilin Flp
MKSVCGFFRRFWSNEQGLETVEYAIIAALITLAAIIAITAVGTNVGTKFQDLADKLK